MATFDPHDFNGEILARAVGWYVCSSVVSVMMHVATAFFPIMAMWLILLDILNEWIAKRYTCNPHDFDGEILARTVGWYVCSSVASVMMHMATAFFPYVASDPHAFRLL